MVFVTGLQLECFDRLHVTLLRISGASYIWKKKTHFSKDEIPLNNYV